MPKPICVKCEVEFNFEEAGVVIAEMFEQNKEIYKLWSADLFKCPICGVEIVSGFGYGAFKHHADGDLNIMLEKIRNNGTRIIYNKELKYV